MDVIEQALSHKYILVVLKGEDETLFHIQRMNEHNHANRNLTNNESSIFMLLVLVVKEEDQLVNYQLPFNNTPRRSQVSSSTNLR